MTKITVVLSHAEAQALADITRQWRRAYNAAPIEMQALDILRKAAVLARRSRSNASVQLRGDEAAALMRCKVALRNGESLSSNQIAALTKVRYALQDAERNAGRNILAGRER